MSDAWAYALGMSVIIIALFAAMGLVRCIWWGAQLLQAKAEGHRLENRMMARELASHDESKKAGFHGR